MNDKLVSAVYSAPLMDVAGFIINNDYFVWQVDILIDHQFS